MRMYLEAYINNQYMCLKNMLYNLFYIKGNGATLEFFQHTEGFFNNNVTGCTRPGTYRKQEMPFRMNHNN